MYSRRAFIKYLGIGALVALSPIPVLSDNKYKDFNPRQQYGDYVEVAGFIDKELFAETYNSFTAQIKTIIPQKYRKDIKWIVTQPAPADIVQQRGFVAWKYVPGVKDDTYPIIVMGSPSKDIKKGYLNV